MTFNIFLVIFFVDFSDDFFIRRYFPTPTTSSGAQREDLQLFSKHWRQKNRSTRLSHAVFLRQPESHMSAHEGAWPTLWCRASTSRLAWRRLALLSLHQSSPNLAYPFFGISASAGFFQPPTTAPFLGRDMCVPWEGLFFISSHFSHLFESRHTRFFFHGYDPTSL